MCWIGREIGFRWLMTARTRMGRATSLDLSATNPQQITLVLEHPPELASDEAQVLRQLRKRPRTPRPRPIVLSVVRFSPQISRQSCSRASRMSRLAARSRSWRQFPVTLFILFPAELDARFIGIDVVLPLRKMRRQRLLVLDAGNHRGFDQLHRAFA